MESKTSEDKALSPSGTKGIAEGISDLVAESITSPKEKKEVLAEGEKKPCETCDEKKEAAKEGPKVRFFIVDKETGREIPAVFKSGGKEHIPDTADKLLTWAGMGIHANRTIEETKGMKEFVDILRRAKEEGRLIIKDESSSPSPKDKVEIEEPGDDTLTDPAVLSLRKDFKAMQDENKELRKTVDSLKTFVLQSKTSEMKQQIETEIDSVSKNYPLGKRRVSQVWKLLAEVDEEGVPTYSVEEAMKKVHGDTLVEIKDYLKDHPELVEKDRISKDAIAQYLSEKEENEKHPVSSPSGTPVATGGGKTEEIKSMADAVEKMKQVLASSGEAGAKV